MYVAGAKGMVVALDAATGTPIWTSTEQAPERGLTYWENADRSDRRLMLTTGGGLRAIDATNGTLITTFGRGRVRRHADGRAAPAGRGPTRHPAASSRT